MISGEKIGSYIAAPETILGADIQDIEALQKKYPYCSTLYILHLKGLALTSDLNFEHQLGKTSIHVPDRTHLYQLIHSKSEELLTINEEVVEPTQPIQELVEKELENVQVASESEEKLSKTNAEEVLSIKPVEAEVKTISEPIEIEEDPVPKQIETKEEITTKSTDEAVILNEESEDKVDFEEGLDETALVELEQGIYNHAIDIAFVQSGIESKEEEVPETEDLTTVEFSFEAPILEDEALPEIEELSFDLAPNAIDQEKEEDETIITGESLSFVEWLKMKQGNPAINEKTEDKTEAPIIEEEIEAQEKPERRNVDALLEKFIADQPSISRPVKDFYNPIKNAKKSIEDSDDFITETLAKIYVLQKNYPKAISAYEKLSELYPDQKANFKVKIKKLKADQSNR